MHKIIMIHKIDSDENLQYSDVIIH